MKNYQKILITTLLFLFALAVPVFGREMTIDELGEEVKLQKPNATYIYVIGEYAFTSEISQFNTQDVMLAARSINVNDNTGKTNADDIYNEMTIFSIDGIVDPDTFLVTGWKKENNVLGKTELGDSLNINYIDYDFVKQLVNTDKLLEKESENTKKNELYGITFDKTNRNIIFDLYDLSKNCSEIDETLLVKSIVNIVNNNEMVTSLTIAKGETSIVFDKAVVSEGADSQSPAWKKFEEMLSKLTGKELKNITLSDLADIKDAITLKITLDEKNAHSQNNKAEETYNIQFTYDIQANISSEIPSEEKTNLKNKFNYTPENTFTISGSKGLYNVGGYITKMEGITGFGSKTTGFYFPYTITLNQDVDLSKVKVKIPKVPNPTKDGDYNIADGSAFVQSTKQLTILMEVEEENEMTYRDIIVEINGVARKIRIEFSNLELRKNTNFEVLDASNENKLKDYYGWQNTDNGYKTEFKAEGKDKVKVSGLITYYDEDFNGKGSPFGGEAKTGYYLAFSVKLSEKKTDKTTVKIFNGYENDAETVATNTNFDDDNNLFVLKHLHLDDSKKTFDIEVDLDGADTKYNAQKITVDWSELKLQETSTGNINYSIIQAGNLGETTQESKDLKNYGYNYETAKAVSISNENGITGTINEQTLLEPSGFKEKTGYFVPVKITVPSEAVSGSWTMTLKDEDGKDKIYKPTQEEYKQGWVLVLFKLNESAEDEQQILKYSIDFDGAYNSETNTGANFMPSNYEIKYDKLEFAKAHTISFEGAEQKAITVWGKTTITEDMLPKDIKASDEYHEFVYWTNKANGKKFETVNLENNNDNIELTAHWYLYSDKFVSAVIDNLKNTQSDKFGVNFVENSGKVDITVTDPTVTVNKMNETNIPGSIAYILLKDEIQKVTLSINGSEKTFTKGSETEQNALKNAIIQGAKDLYSPLLNANFAGKTDEQVTINDLANNENLSSFTLKIDETGIADTVTLAKTPSEVSAMSIDTVPTEYTFKFSSDMALVRNQTELENELTQGTHKTIYIGASFEIDKNIEINKSIVINGGGHKITAKNSSVFTIGAKNITINNLVLSTNNTDNEGIIVKDGTVLNADVVDLSECKAAGFTVEIGGTLNGENLIYTTEKYKNPLVRAYKQAGNKKAIVNVVNTNGETATATTIQTIERYDESTDQSNAIDVGDTIKEDTSYNYVNYYNNRDNSVRYIKITYIGNRAITGFPKTFVRYYDKEAGNTPSNIEPPDTIKYLTTYENSLATYSVGKWASGDTAYDKGQVPAPKGETYYIVELVATYKEGTIKVSNEKALRDAVKADSTAKVVILDGVIELKSGELDIAKSEVLITGTESGKIKLNGGIKGKIKVNGNKVTLDQMLITGSAESLVEGRNDIVTINGTDFKSSQVTISGDKVGEKNWDSALYYTHEDPVTILFYNTFNGSNLTKFIEFGDSINGYTRIIGNNFHGANETEEFILINGIDEGANVEIKQQTATFVGENEYGVRIEAPINKTTATISLGEFWKRSTNRDVLKIAIDVTDSKYDVSGYTFTAGSVFEGKIQLVYVKDGKTTEDNPMGKEYNATLKIGEKIISSPASIDTANVYGLKKNGNSYSGVLSQSPDGKFYLPVTITSNNLVDNVSTVTVTNPNGEVQKYTYSESSENGVASNENAIANISNNKTMNLQLEAIKSSKIVSGNGKKYKLELDVDGASLNNYEVKEFLIDYSDVDTMVEVINNAAQRTQEANSLTVEKNNNIKGGKEEFTYKYDKENNLTYYLSKDKKEEQYSFKLKTVVPSHNGPIVLSMNKKDENFVPEEIARPELNDWVFANFLTNASMGAHEISLLQDVISDKTSIEAIQEVKAVDGKEHTYEVIMNTTRFNKWLDSAYRDGAHVEETTEGESKQVKLEVVLDADEKYLVSFKTMEDFNLVTTSGLTYKNNKVSVKFSNVGNTEITKPNKFLAKEGQELSEEDFIAFYEACKKWHKKTTGAEIYEGE